MQRQLAIILFVFSCLMFLSFTQSDTICSDVVDDVLARVPDMCDATGRNQMCYGNPNVVVQPQPDIDDFQFSSIGDIEDVIKLQSLRLSQMDTSVPEWGVTLFRLQTNLPNSLPGQNVTFLLFGDTHMEPAQFESEMPAVIIADQPVNIRSLPTTRSDIVATVDPNTSVVATGITASGNWIRLLLEDGTTEGWIAEFLVSLDGDDNNLAVVSQNDSDLTPGQAIYFSSGIGDRQCNEAPDSGLMIQTPQGIGQVNFTINGVDISVGSTLFVQAAADDYLYIYVLEGQIEVNSFGVTKVVPQGAFITIPIGENLLAVAAPDNPQPYEIDDLTSLPIQLLPDEITIADPVTSDILSAAIPCTGVNTAAINMRSGPGTGYTATSRSANQTSDVVGQAQGTDGFTWYLVDESQWIRSDLLDLSDNCTDIDIVTDIPELPTPIPVVETNTDSDTSTTDTTSTTTTNTNTQSFSGTNFIGLNSCYNVNNLRAGQRVEIDVGMGRWDTPEEAAAVLAPHSASISVDGQSLDVWYVGITLHVGGGFPDGYGDQGRAYWIATSGDHTAVGQWTNGPTSVCTFTVP